MVLGLSFNNAPTVEDALTPCRPGASFTARACRRRLAPRPDRQPGAEYSGLTAYAWINSQFYVEVGGLPFAERNVPDHGGSIHRPGAISGVAPMGGSLQKNFGGHNFEVGAFGMSANSVSGRDESTGFTDHIPTSA